MLHHLKPLMATVSNMKKTKKKKKKKNRKNMGRIEVVYDFMLASPHLARIFVGEENADGSHSVQLNIFSVERYRFGNL